MGRVLEAGASETFDNASKNLDLLAVEPRSAFLTDDSLGRCVREQGMPVAAFSGPHSVRLGALGEDAAEIHKEIADLLQLLSL